MPKGDRTGPMGAGSRSGRAMGFCGGFRIPGYANTAAAGAPGMGMGRMRGGWPCRADGWRRGRQRYFAQGMQGWSNFNRYSADPPALSAEQEEDYLQDRSQALKSELDVINKRLNEIASQENAK